VFLSRTGLAVPPVILNHVAQFKALQETAVSLTVIFEEVPRVAEASRAEVRHVDGGLWHVTARFGFVEIPNLALALAIAQQKGCPLDLDDTIYVAARDEVVQSQTHLRLPTWQRLLFGFMYRNAVRAPDRFILPVDKFLEIGRPVRL
jgi:KUP system potassium uptake protein